MNAQEMINNLKNLGYDNTFKKIVEEEKTSKFRTCFGEMITPEQSAKARIESIKSGLMQMRLPAHLRSRPRV